MNNLSEWKKRQDEIELKSKIYSLVVSLFFVFAGLVLIYQCISFHNENQALYNSKVSSMNLEIDKVERTLTIHATVQLATITAYSSDPAETDDTPYIMANGKRPHEGVIACPRSLPFDTEVEIDGKTYNCEDRMALKNDGKFDIWMPTKKQAIDFGYKVRPVIIKGR